ncbi:MAG: SGNH/GDSL hydrolase family protein [Deltaproteobacteria bacterium]|nr:SGNH/GDSL hydrolase family protein [Deltaproteobacteria bacterium]
MAAASSPQSKSVRPVRPAVKWTVRIGAVAFGLLLGAAAAEGVLRMAARAGMTGGPPQRPRDADIAGLPSIEGVFSLAKRNQRANYRGALYFTNSEGFRGPEYAKTKPPGTFRIEMIGDSFTMGSGVRVEQAYPALVESALNAAGEARRYEVLNLGLSGLSLRGIIEQRLLPVGLAYDPDMLVYGFTVNDLEGPAYQRIARVPGEPSGSLLFDLIHERWDYVRDIVWPSRSSYVRELDDNFFRTPAAWRAFEDDLDRLATIAGERGVCVTVLLHTQLTALNSLHPFLRHYDAVARAARARGMFVAESFPYFEGVDDDQYMCGVFDPHPNIAGHQVLAEALLHRLRELPAECWRER